MTEPYANVANANAKQCLEIIICYIICLDYSFAPAYDFIRSYGGYFYEKQTKTLENKPSSIYFLINHPYDEQFIMVTCQYVFIKM